MANGLSRLSITKEIEAVLAGHREVLILVRKFQVIPAQAGIH